MGIRGQYKNKRDANEPAIFSVLEGYGFQIRPLDTPCDAIVGFSGVNMLIEIKNGPKAPLTGPQEAFHRNWTGQIKVLSSEAEAHSWAKNVTLAISAGFNLVGEVQ